MTDSEKKCEVAGCGEAAERSISRKKVEATSLSVPEGHGNVHLCKKHYRDMKKEAKGTIPDYMG